MVSRLHHNPPLLSLKTDAAHQGKKHNCLRAEKVAYKPVLDPEQKREFRESLMIMCLGNQPKLLYNRLRILWQKDAETHSPGQQGPGRSHLGPVNSYCLISCSHSKEKGVC